MNDRPRIHRSIGRFGSGLTLPILTIAIAVILFPGAMAAFAETPDPDQLAKLIDLRIEERLETEGVTPAPLADDAEFLRRVSLDVTGKIPHASEVRDFLADSDPDKRAKLVDAMLERPSYIIHQTNLWRAAMIPEADADPTIRLALPGFESWLRSRIAENRNFAEIVDEILTLPVDAQNVSAFNQPDAATPVAFYIAKESKPERVAAASARLFLGVRIDCAQCHDHPFDDWKQDQFWQHAAFFSDLPQVTPLGQEAEMPTNDVGEQGTILIPETDRTVVATFLDQSTPVSVPEDRTRKALADWIVSSENPYFAKAAANRIWSYHFGLGLVEPMDDFSAHNPASHPELLKELAEAFRAGDYDFKLLIRAITRSRTYQRSSVADETTDVRRSLLARMPVRGMTAEQIFDSLAVATGYRQPFDPEQPLNFNNDAARQEFLATFGVQNESAPDRTTTILQALSLMNGDFVGDATDLADSRTLAAVVDAPFLSLQEKIEALYLSTLSRKPSDEELTAMIDYATRSNDSADNLGSEEVALADIFWVLLNSSEFLLNH
ncbi:hypothetical protein KOR42_08170 [Thalassoglobus neptunius]|uniref:Cytochrome c domain-containing protein n=1 Tax=Thalassoglobus neptunius TaxID=1938619 RepID=A0A5C5X3C0_9PLAN|nr:DUF1553 domain-containing protein [Thalassoglobus neptunius]TWT57456.1 hypothetical protein KOR42_08170 [Thalassoglobus neptunius]